jgi:hypothetical protein
MSKIKNHLHWQNWCDENPDIASNPQEFMKAVFARLSWLEEMNDKSQATINGMNILERLIEDASEKLREGQSIAITITRREVRITSFPYVETIEIPASEAFLTLHYCLEHVVETSIAFGERCK